MTIPELPSQPPNFRVKADFNSYQKPVMTVIEEDNASVIDEDVLLDFNNGDSLNNSSSSANDLSAQQLQLQNTNQQYIQQLLMEIERLRSDLDRLHNESQFEIRGLRERIKLLNDDLMRAKTEIEQERIRRNEMEETVRIMSENEKSKSDLDNLESKSSIFHSVRFAKCKTSRIVSEVKNSFTVFSVL
jgi:hypothetical protein